MSLQFLPPLDPAAAALLASDPYPIRKQSLSQALKFQETQVITRTGSYIASANQITGGTGLAASSRSGIGIFAKGAGDFKGQAVLAFRGTQSCADIFTDLCTGLTTYVNWNAAHAGFSRAFETMKQRIDYLLGNIQYKAIHCIGHSLGGAIATLTANYLSSKTNGPIALYTFGSPRVGGPAFAKGLTARIGAQNIYRVYHHCDPVAMIPLFPFTHVPAPGITCPLGEEHGFPIPACHKMTNTYLPMTEGQSWSTLRKPVRSHFSDEEIGRWLKSATAPGMRHLVAKMLIPAVQFIFRKLATTAGFAAAYPTLQVALCGGFSLIDYCAVVLHTAAHKTVEYQTWVLRLLSKVAASVGHMAHLTVSLLTPRFIKDLLQALIDSVARTAQAAIRMLS